MHDLVIRGGTVVDGTGKPGYRGDVAVDGGRISAVGEVPDKGREEIEADGHVVAPGFVDVHTHYDAQYTWDPYATSSIWHGVTTTVIGNCGFAIAPCRPEHRDIAIDTLVNVEGMSQAAMQQGINWNFETFPQYLDALEGARPSLNVGVLLGHSAVRMYVMGEDSQHRAATEDEVRTMAGLTREAMQAGALGLGSSTAEAHNGAGGLPVPSRLAEKQELAELIRAMGEGGKGLFEITIGNTTSMEDLKAWHDYGRRPIVWAAFFHRDDRPEWTKERLAATEAFVRDGVDIHPQVSCRPLTMDFTMRSPYPFEGLPCWKQVSTRPREEWKGIYADPAFRESLRDDIRNRRFSVFRGNWPLVQVLRAEKPENKVYEGLTIPEVAQRMGTDEVDAFLDLTVADDLGVEFVAGLMNTNEEVVGKLISHPDTLISLSDAGAHISLLCDAGYSTHLLGYWVREKGVMSLEEAVRRLTSVPADMYRIPERGRIAAGNWGDLVVFDPQTVRARPNEWVTDLPAGEPRFIARADGVACSIVNGVPVLKHGEVLEREAAERPGHLLRKFSA